MHEHGHTLDLIMARPGDNLIHSTKIGTLISNHHVIHSSLNLKKPALPQRKVEYCCLKKINITEIRNDLLNTLLLHHLLQT